MIHFMTLCLPPLTDFNVLRMCIEYIIKMQILLAWYAACPKGPQSERGIQQWHGFDRMINGIAYDSNTHMDE
jgi:hypothetical protein